MSHKKKMCDVCNVDIMCDIENASPMACGTNQKENQSFRQQTFFYTYASLFFHAW